MRTEVSTLHSFLRASYADFLRSYKYNLSSSRHKGNLRLQRSMLISIGAFGSIAWSSSQNVHIRVVLSALIDLWEFRLHRSYQIHFRLNFWTIRCIFKISFCCCYAVLLFILHKRWSITLPYEPSPPSLNLVLGCRWICSALYGLPTAIVGTGTCFGYT